MAIMRSTEPRIARWIMTGRFFSLLSSPLPQHTTQFSGINCEYTLEINNQQIYKHQTTTETRKTHTHTIAVYSHNFLTFIILYFTSQKELQASNTNVFSYRLTDDRYKVLQYRTHLSSSFLACITMSATSNIMQF